MTNDKQSKVSKKLNIQDMSEVIGGVATRTVYSGHKPSFNHPISLKHEIDNLSEHAKLTEQSKN